MSSSYLHVLELTEHCIGYGSFGVVFHGLWKGRKVAAKKVLHDDCIISLSEIIPLNKHLDHPNIIHIIAVSAPFIVMELCNENLKQHLLEPKNHCNEMNFMKQIAKGLEYLHQNQIVHCDLKPDNILLKWDSLRLITIKLCDFGLSTDITNRTHMSTVAGNDNWLAPEFFSQEGRLKRAKYHSPIDIFSMGKVFTFIVAPISKREDISNTACK